MTRRYVGDRRFDDRSRRQRDARVARRARASRRSADAPRRPRDRQSSSLRHVEMLVPRGVADLRRDRGTGVVEDVTEHDPRAFRHELARFGLALAARAGAGDERDLARRACRSSANRDTCTAETATGSVRRCRCRTSSSRESAIPRSPASATPSPPISPPVSSSARRCASRSTAERWSTCGAAGSTPSGDSPGNGTRSPASSRAPKGSRRSRLLLLVDRGAVDLDAPGRSLLARVRRRGQGRAAGALPAHARGGPVGDREADAVRFAVGLDRDGRARSPSRSRGGSPDPVTATTA